MATVSKSAPAEYKKIPKTLKQIEKQFTALSAKRAELEKHQAELIKRGCEYGQLAWKKQRTNKKGKITEYPRLYYSASAVQKMKRVRKVAKIGYNYVNKNANIEDIKKNQERGKQLDQADQEITRIDSMIRQISYELESITLIG